MSLESSNSHPDRIKCSRHTEQVLGQMRDEIGNIDQYSSQELYDMISFLKEFCVTLEDEAMSRPETLNQPIHDDLPLF